MPLLRAATAWFAATYGVTLDPASQALSLVGSQEGLAHMLLALTDPGDTMLLPSVAYPSYFGAMQIAGIKPAYIPLLPGSHLPDFDALTQQQLAQASVLLLNYPNNPTVRWAARVLCQCTAAIPLRVCRASVQCARSAGLKRPVLCCCHHRRRAWLWTTPSGRAFWRCVKTTTCCSFTTHPTWARCAAHARQCEPHGAPTVRMRKSCKPIPGVQVYDRVAASSPLALPGGVERCVELHSFAKSYQLGGFRLGFALGNAAALASLEAVKVAGSLHALRSSDHVQQQCVQRQQRRTPLHAHAPFSCASLLPFCTAAGRWLQAAVDFNSYLGIQRMGVACLQLPAQRVREYARVWQSRAEALVAALAAQQHQWQIAQPRACELRAHGCTL